MATSRARGSLSSVTSMESTQNAERKMTSARLRRKMKPCRVMKMYMGSAMSTAISTYTVRKMLTVIINSTTSLGCSPLNASFN